MTTTDLARFEHNTVVAVDSASDALARLGQWVEAASHAHQLVGPLVGTPFVPDAYKPKVDPRATAEQKAEARQIAIANATAAVLQGITLGLDPMTALQQIYVVHGRPGMYTRIKVALVQSRGHEIWTEDISDTRAVVAGRRKGTDHIERVVVTMDMARKAGWTRNEAYTKTPQDMLWSRAAGRVCDRIAPDALMGIASVEEIQDELAPANGHRTVTPRRRVEPERAAIAAAPEPPLDDEPTIVPPEPTPADPAAEPGITQAQQRKLHALLRDRGLADREAGLAFISMTLGEDFESTKDLTRQQAATVIDALEAAAGELEEPPLPAFDGDGPATAEPGSGATP